MTDPFFEEGREAYFASFADWGDCPYPDGSDGEFGWHKGWYFADQTPSGTILVIGEEHAL